MERQGGVSRSMAVMFFWVGFGRMIMRVTAVGNASQRVMMCELGSSLNA